MREKRLRLPGRFVEAYLYFDFVWLFGRDGSIRAFDIANYCTSSLNGDATAAIALFSDNRMLAPEKLGQPALRNIADQLLVSGKEIELTDQDVDRFSYVFDDALSFKTLLDTRFYYGRGYIGTDSSIHQIEALSRQSLTSERLGRATRSKLRQSKISDRPARSLRSRFGAIGAACGNAGGLIGFEAANEDPSWTLRLEPFAEKSFGLELNGHAITNLVDATTIQLYAAKLRIEPSQAAPPDAEEFREPARLEGLEGPSYTNQTGSLNSIVQTSDAAAVFLFNKTVWRFALDGSAERVETFDNKHHLLSEFESKPVRTSPPGRVLGMSSTAAGVLAETDDQVSMFGPHGWECLVDEAVHSMRGYQNSKRYQHVVTAVMRDRVELIAVWR